MRSFCETFQRFGITWTLWGIWNWKWVIRKWVGPPHFLLPPLANKRHTGSSQQPMRFLQFIYIYLYLYVFWKLQMSELDPIIFICMLEVGSCHLGGFPSKMIKTNQKMPEPEAQQVPGGGGLTSYSFRTCPLYFVWVSYLTLCPLILLAFCP